MSTDKNDNIPALTIVDEVVKDSILRHFSIYPSRAHVLEQALLVTGNGFNWVEQEDGMFVLLCDYRDGEQPERIEHKELRDDADELLARVTDYNSGIAFRNLIADWISDNIDVYCTRRYVAALGGDLSPTKAGGHFFSSSSALGSMPDAAKIHPDWRAAIEEMVSDQYNLIWANNLPRGSREALDYVRQYHPDLADLYLALMHAQEKLNAVKPANNTAYLQSLVERQYSEVTEKAAKAKWVAPSFEEFVHLANTDFKKGQIMVHETLVEFVVGRQKDMHRFFPNGKPNAEFERQAMAIIENCTMFNQYPQASTLIYDIKLTLEISTACESLVETYVNDVLPMLFAAS